ncbi:uncharacterized protein CLAFUR5_13752 [Fulvia fulva]|uniref:Uncharacterized protein n=1 Tax=Passalora fulva TaxID=5499 RepID=A0A9Q8UVX3_PASFU|nr:uncharacterized protein CLAFUR5_13752 [Fulvia fulva]UJO24431.1 hypothetical protein CLAFUR5_13752 [Fulvia fulva]WPV37115.1 hypothetical protein CLAFUW7_13918 [Fulvia fulva]
MTQRLSSSSSSPYTMTRGADSRISRSMSIGDTYWRLRTYRGATIGDLRKRAQNANYHIKKSASLGETIAAVHRLDRGLVSYANCTLQELRRFHEDRGLGKAPKLGQRILIKALDSADDNATFTKLLDLPAKLRCCIYDFYIDGFQNDTLWDPTHPPLSQTYKLIRSEFLPIFFGTICFQLAFQSTTWGHEAPHRYRLRYETQLFLGSLQPENLATMSRFNVDFTHGSGDFSNVKLRLNKAEKVWAVEVVPNREPNVFGLEAMERIEKEARKGFHGDEGEAKSLTMDDLYAVRKRVDERGFHNFTPPSYQFLASLGPQNLAQISSFEMVFYPRTRLVAKLDKAENVWHVSVVLELSRWSSDVSAAAQLEKDVRQVLGGDPDEAKPLTLERVYSTRRNVESAFPVACAY